jgi:hypothetical protein
MHSRLDPWMEDRQHLILPSTISKPATLSTCRMKSTAVTPSVGTAKRGSLKFKFVKINFLPLSEFCLLNFGSAEIITEYNPISRCYEL